MTRIAAAYLARSLSLALLGLLLGGISHAADGVTTIRMTDDVLVEDVSPFGINLGGDAYYSGAALVKMRVRENFEGTMYRRCDFGPGSDAQGVATWFSPRDPWRELMIGGEYTILSGPSKWTTGVIRDIDKQDYMHERKMTPFDHFVVDKPLTVDPDNTRIGIMVTRDRTSDGQMRRPGDYWCSEDNEISIGDTSPETFGVAAMRMKPTEKPAYYRFATHYQRYGETNGVWRVRFQAKAASGEPTLSFRADRDYGGRFEVSPTGEWTQFEKTITVDAVPEPKTPKDNPHLLFVAEVEGGDVLLDDVEIWMEGDENPTAFRDDVVAMLKRYRPGVLRKLQMGGSTIENAIRPPMQSFSYSSEPGAKIGPYEGHSRDPYGLHQMYELCEYIGCDPWYCLPGTLTREEMAAFMEYIGAPADVGLGKLRAELGHPQPWTEVFDAIHVEFGNEAWNNAGPYQCGGYNGPDYWEGLIATGKESPYYQPHVVFHAAGQASYSGRNEGIMRDCPNADCFSVAPYIIQGFSKDEVANYYDTPEKLFRWAFAWPILRSRSEAGAMKQNFDLANAAGMELSIYEVNHHITHGDGPLEPRNELVTSIGGGLNVANNMLQMLKEHHLRTQALFSLVQHGYNASGVGEVRLWGTALCMREGQERYRPTFLACATANRVLGGDLVATTHEGDDPVFSATGVLPGDRNAQTVDGLPVLWSYAFRDGDRRALIVVNLDVTDARNVRIASDGDVTGSASAWLLGAPSITSNNEYEAGDPQVAVREAKIDDFRNGYEIALPAHSMTVFEWNVAP